MSYRVLIVDDDDLNREVMEAFLLLNGYSVLMTGNGTRAIELSKSELPDLIILDMRLPDLSGLEVTEAIRNDVQISGIPILMITGLSDPQVRKQALQMGVNQFLKRPFGGDDFIAEVASLLSAQS